MVSTTACGRPLKLPRPIQEPHMEVPQVWRWCQMVPSPWERIVLPQRNGPGRGCREENEFGRKPGPGGPERRDQQDLLLVLPDFAQCLCEQAHWGNAYLHRARGQLCASASVPRVALGQGENHWQWEDSREANRSTWASPNRLQNSRIVSDGVAILRGKSELSWERVGPHDWAPPECGQRAAIWAACDSRGGDGGRAVTCGVIVYPPIRLIYDTAAVLSVRTNTCLPNSSGRNCRQG